jgi:PAS domain-containing protein
MHLETGYQGPRPVFGLSKGRKRHRRDISAAPSLPLANATNQAVAVFNRHSYVGDHYVGSLLRRTRGNQRVGFRGGTDSNYFCAVLSERRLRQFARLNQARTLETLRESEARARRTMAEHMVAGVGECDSTGKFILVNQRLCDIVGYTEAELLELRISDITQLNPTVLHGSLTPSRN